MFQYAKGFFYKHYIIYKKSQAEKATLFIYPLVSLFSIGILALYLEASGAPSNAIPFVIVGTMAWTFYELCQRAMVYGMTLDIWDYCTKHMILSPAGLADYIIGNSLFGLSSGTFALAILSALSAAFFGFSIFSTGLVFVMSLFVAFIFAVSMGLGILSMMVAYDKEYLAFTWSMPGVIMVFSGVYYPVSMLPGFVRDIAYILPTTYAIDAMRISIGLASGSVGQEILRGLIISVAYLALFFWTFSTSLNRARNTGRTISG